MSSSGSEPCEDPEPETYDSISILELNENAGYVDAEAGERVIVSGVKRNLNKYVEEDGIFVQYADHVATIELNQTLTDGELDEWCNSEVGSHVLAHYFDHAEIPTEAQR